MVLTESYGSRVLTLQGRQVNSDRGHAPRVVGPVRLVRCGEPNQPAVTALPRTVVEFGEHR
jgi:hypothetical protein